MITENEVNLEIRDIISLLINKIPFCMPIISKPIKQLISKDTFTATDGDFIYVNYENWMKLNVQRKLGTLFKAYLHFALLHPSRGKDKKFDLWWAACSFWANSVIMTDSSGGSTFDLPDGFMYDDIFLDKTAEEIYNMLEDSIDKKKNNELDYSPYGTTKKFQNSKNKTNVVDDFVNDKVENVEKDMSQGLGGNEEQIKHETGMAMEMHKTLRHGKLPLSLDRELNKLVNSRIKWTKILEAFWKQITNSDEDRSYSNPQKWAWEYGYALPGDVGFKKPTATIIIDTSGSITQVQINTFLSEIARILDNVDYCWVITCDAKVHEVAKIKRITDITVQKKIKMRGGGGTSFVPSLKEAKTKDSDLTIYFTDGIGEYGKNIGVNNLLWIIAGSEIKPPFGKSIYM